MVLKRTLVSFAVAACCLEGSARGDTILGPVVDPANGNSYYLLSETSWADAESQAVALGGTLAVVNDQAEQNWIFEDFPLPQNAFIWLGARDQQIPDWVWVDGSPFTYTNWGGGGGITEPDGNVDVGESFLAMFTPGSTRSGTWADLYNDNPDVYGLVEVGSVTAVPLPSAFYGGAGILAAFWVYRLVRRPVQIYLSTD